MAEAGQPIEGASGQGVMVAIYLLIDDSILRKSKKTEDKGRRGTTERADE
jgi:hypothetical protein